MAIAPIGPLTNIALLLRLYPDLAPRIAHLSIMGGSIGEGNTTVSAEFNIYADPEAADVVFRSGVPITMMGLDVTHQALLDRSLRRGAPRRSAPTSARIAAELTDFALDRNMEWSGRTTTAIHDAVAVAHLAIPDLVDVAPYHVAVDTTTARRAVGPCATASRIASGAMAGPRTPRSASGSTGAVRVGPPRGVRIAAVGRIRYVALGDSYTIGTSVDRRPSGSRTSWSAADTARSSSSRTSGVNGYTTADLIRDELPALHRAGTRSS